MSHKTIAYFKTDTIAEAVFEIRFDTTLQPAFLPGLLYGIEEVKARFPSSEALPASQLPVQLLNVNPELLFTATHKMVGGKEALLVGPRSLAFSVTKPYPRWNNFRTNILWVIGVAKKAQIYERVISSTLRYINVFPLTFNENPFGLDALNLHVKFGDNEIHPRMQQSEGVFLRADIRKGEFQTTTLITAPAKMTSPKDSSIVAEGALLDISVQRQYLDHYFEAKTESIVDETHEIEKSIFMSLLTKNATDMLEPIYE